ncbi:MAG: FtsW/RodA/SpoVE family cell cycle protein [bacterium]|nr:FtsW/RodA/SpoVE family cell cycle protein [bacterium]
MFKKFDLPITFSLIFLITLSSVVLESIAPAVFPTYFLYIALGVILYIVFSQIDFDVISLFSGHFYIVSVIFLVATLIIGKVTRGVVRWIPIGDFSIQAAEFVRPFLLVFFANRLTEHNLNAKRLFGVILLFLIPFGLILAQPSLGVALITGAGLAGILLAANIKKRYFLWIFFIAVMLIPVFWTVLAPYQKSRVITFLNPARDPLGKGYNSIQSKISVGSGKLFGRGLGKGVQTQLFFLPERQTDFIFASIAEETGLVGGVLVLIGMFVILWRLAVFTERSKGPPARAYLSGLFMVFFIQICIHIGMNMGMLPITGIPLPLLSAGGSSLLATMIGLGIANGAYKK